jgi:hypothetical protein
MRRPARFPQRRLAPARGAGTRPGAGVPGHRAERADERDTQAQLRTGETREGEGRDRAEREPTDQVGDRAPRWRRATTEARRGDDHDEL